MNTQIELIEKKLLLTNKTFIIIENEITYLIKVKCSDGEVTNDFGFNKETENWFHNKNTNKGNVWNYSRDENSSSIGWYYFTTEEILKTIASI